MQQLSLKKGREITKTELENIHCSPRIESIKEIKLYFHRDVSLNTGK